MIGGAVRLGWMRRFSWPAFVVATVYFSLVVGLLIVGSQENDAEGIHFTWLILTMPWILFVPIALPDQLRVGSIPLAFFAAIILNSATVYGMVALGIAGFRKVLGDNGR